MRSKQSLSVTLTIALSFLLAGCNQAPSSSEVEQLSQAWKEKIKSLSGSSKEEASEEISKLFVHEYHVEEIPLDADVSEIQTHLQKLGLERWDCFHIERRATGMLLLCKRQPKTYLRYIPRLF